MVALTARMLVVAALSPREDVSVRAVLDDRQVVFSGMASLYGAVLRSWSG